MGVHVHTPNYGLLTGLLCKKDLDAQDVNKQLVICDTILVVQHQQQHWKSTMQLTFNLLYIFNNTKVQCMQRPWRKPRFAQEPISKPCTNTAIATRVHSFRMMLDFSQGIFGADINCTMVSQPTVHWFANVFEGCKIDMCQPASYSFIVHPWKSQLVVKKKYTFN